MSSLPRTPRVSLWEWTQTALLAVNLAWTTLCLGGYRPETFAVTAGLTCALLAVHFLARVFAPGPRPHPAGWLFVPFLVYTLVSVFKITPVPWLGWRDWLWWANFGAVFWVVLNGVRSPAPRQTLFLVLVALGAIATALACYQHFVQPTWLMLGRVQADQFISRSTGSFGIPNSLAAFLLLLIPPTGALAFRRGLSPVVRLAVGLGCVWLTLGLVLTISRGAWLGLALALAAWPLCARSVSWPKRLLSGLATLVAVAAVGSALFFVSSSVRGRLEAIVRDRGETTRPIMWRGAWQLFREHPAVGTGAGSYNVVFEKYRPEKFRDEPQWAHNDYLNTLSDYGLVGFLLFFGAGGFIAGRCASRAPKIAPADGCWFEARATMVALAIGLLAFALHLFVDFHLKIPALAMAFATLSALTVGRWWSVDASQSSGIAGRVFSGWAAVATVAAGVLVVTPKLTGEALRYGARQRIDGLAAFTVDSPDYRERLKQSREELARAVALDPSNAQAWADIAYSAALRGHIAPAELPVLGKEAEAAANRAVAISPLSAEFWIRRGVAKDMQGRWYDGSVDFVNATSLAPCAGWVWFYYADHLSRKANERGLTDAAVAMSLRLDPQNRDALALCQRLAISQKAGP